MEVCSNIYVFVVFQSYGSIDDSESDSLPADLSNVTLLLIGRESGLLLFSRIAMDTSGLVSSAVADTTELLLDLPVRVIVTTGYGLPYSIFDSAKF